jgi:hypothetical protein
LLQLIRKERESPPAGSRRNHAGALVSPTQA